MATIHDINDPKASRIQPIKVLNPVEWQGQPIPEREWLVPGICVKGGATLLNGDGGVGKSLLCMQLQTALALGQPWLGINTPAKATKSLGIYCEDEPDELHRRQADICKYYGCTMGHLEGVSMISRVGENNTLMSFDRRAGGGIITPFFRQVEAMINDNGIEVIIIDTAADTFGGMEIDREQVRTFVQKIRGWALRTRGAVIITQHPSISGMASGSGASGSTGWNNSVRSRIYLTAPKRVDDDGDEIPTDERFLKFMKSNYGPKGAKLRLMWKDGVFVPISEVTASAVMDENKTREILLDVCAELIRKGGVMSPEDNGRSTLVSQCRTNASLARLPAQILIKAQGDLIDRGDLVIVEVKRPNRHVAKLIRPSWLKYPNECEG